MNNTHDLKLILKYEKHSPYYLLILSFFLNDQTIVINLRYCEKGRYFFVYLPLASNNNYQLRYKHATNCI